MKSVFDASTGVEAYMIKNLLETYDIESEVFGEHLQGGVGELQAIGLVRVMVESADYDQAKSIVQEWEAIETESIDEVNPARESKGFLYFFIGLVLGMCLVFAVLKTPITSDGIDYDGDGNLEEKWTYNGHLIRKYEFDRNDDGVVDQIYYYDLDGIIKSGETDLDFDGIYEATEEYRNGKIVAQLVDNDADGFAEHREIYVLGVFSKATFYNPKTKKVKKVVRYEGGIKIISAEIDSNDDGSLDTVYEYDQYDEIINTKTILSGSSD